jgi:hypothetical protein
MRRKVTRIVAAALTVATLCLLAAIPLVASWRMSAGQCIAVSSIDEARGLWRGSELHSRGSTV